MSDWFTEYDAESGSWGYDDYWAELECAIRRVRAALFEAIAPIANAVLDALLKVADWMGEVDPQHELWHTGKYPHTVSRKGNRSARLGKVARLNREKR